MSLTNKRKSFMTLMVIAVGVVAISLLTAGCPQTSTNALTESDDEILDTSIDWKNVELTDVRNGDKFTVNSLRGKTVVLENMAVWCTTCLSQQKQMEDAQGELGEDVVFISLDIDPNERTGQLEDHVNRHGFDWAFTIDPNVSVGSQLAAEYGINVLNPPSTPIILIDKDGSEKLLPLGRIKSSSDIVREVRAVS